MNTHTALILIGALIVFLRLVGFLVYTEILPKTV